jgi:bacteriocin resistance YdeI/OmpD-like protein
MRESVISTPNGLKRFAGRRNRCEITRRSYEYEGEPHARDVLEGSADQRSGDGRAARCERRGELWEDYEAIGSARAQNAADLREGSVSPDKFSPSHRREYIEWLTEAKTEATRAKRLATALEWMAEGKPRNWKYMPQKQGQA